MTQLYCLVGFTAWALILVIGIGGVRVLQVVTGKKRPNEFPGGAQHGGDLYWRLNRAHVNAAENLPIFAALVLTSSLIRLDVTRLAQVVLVARVVQSLIHISSGRSMAANLRFGAFMTQVGCYGAMIWKLTNHL